MNTIHGQLTQGTFLDAVRDASCKEQGEQAEQLFARLRGEKILRAATQIENRDEHWDLFDKG